MPVEMTIDAKGFEKMAKVLEENQKEFKAAAVSALNKAITETNTALQREITRAYNIKKSSLTGGKEYSSSGSNNLISVKKANYNNLDAQIAVRGAPLTMGRFLKSGKKIRVEVIKGQVRQFSADRYTALEIGGNRHIFEKDHGLKMLHTLSTAQMASNDKVAETSLEKSNEILAKKIEQETIYRLNKIARKTE